MFKIANLSVTPVNYIVTHHQIITNSDLVISNNTTNGVFNRKRMVH